MLTLCGLSILYQGLDLKQEGKLMQESQRLVAAVIKNLEKAKAPGAADFRRLAASMLPVENQTKTNQIRTPHNMPAPTTSKSTPSPSVARQQIRPQIYRHGSATMSETDLLSQQEKLRRATLPSISMHRQEQSLHGRTPNGPNRSESPMSRREYRVSSSAQPAMLAQRSIVKNEKVPNLDYLSLSNTPVQSQPQSPMQQRSQHAHQQTSTSSYSSGGYSAPKASGVSVSEWEVLLGSLDGGQTNLYDAIYGGPALSIPDNASSHYGDWSPDSQWDMTSLNMHDFTSAPAARSVLSFSEESLSSGEDLSTSDLGLGRQDYTHLIPGSVSSGENYLLEGLDAAFGL